MGIPIEGGFAGVKSGFEPLPNGVYDATVSDGEVRTAGPDAKYPGNQYIAWEFTISEDEYEGRKVWLNTSLVESAKPMLKMFLEAVGYSEDDLDSSEFELEVEDIIGRTLRVVVTKGTNPKTNEPNNSVKRVLPVGEAESALPS